MTATDDTSALAKKGYLFLDIHDKGHSQETIDTITQANQHLQDKDFDTALEKVNSILTQDENNVHALLILCSITLQTGNSEQVFQQALTLVDKVLSIDPNSMGGLSSKSLILAGMGEFEQAHEVNQKMLSVQDNDIGALIMEMQYFMRKQDLEKGLEMLNKAVEDGRDVGIFNKVSAAISKANLLNVMGKRNDAIVFCAECQQKFPDHAQRFYQLQTQFMFGGMF
jgi:tetratricopeptide (TPR) repeat protein